ncbi:MAG: urease accessory UreF family protein, partial [Merismopediaceae bacterium]|nr:urease accessory UreF family protein [Merismopediaceae bacterium]
MLQDFLSLLQLVSPALPVGAYSYSEGLEWLIHQGIIHDAPTLERWLATELSQGSIRVELAILLRAYRAAQTQDLATLKQWNAYLSANWDSAELRQQSWQMGQSLSRLVGQLYQAVQPMIQALGTPCNYAIAWGMAAA